MQLTHEIPDYAYTLRSANGCSARVNDRTLMQSFILAPNELIEQWEAASAATLTPESMAPLLALKPEMILLGSGERQSFPPASAMAACLTQGIGIEVMSNAAAARTFNVLAGEGRRVVAGFLLRQPD